MEQQLADKENLIKQSNLQFYSKDKIIAYMAKRIYF